MRKATVLYFALEDDYPRLQKRLFQMFGAKETGNLYFATECKTVNGGLEEQIRGFMREHPDTGLIIIDTLKRVREAGGADYSYASDYDVVARLKALADSYKGFNAYCSSYTQTKIGRYIRYDFRHEWSDGCGRRCICSQ